MDAPCIFDMEPPVVQFGIHRKVEIANFERTRRIVYGDFLPREFVAKQLGGEAVVHDFGVSFPKTNEVLVRKILEHAGFEIV